MLYGTLAIRSRAPDKEVDTLQHPRCSATEHPGCYRVATSYKLLSIDRFSYIVPIMAGHDGRKNLVLHASNYIVHLYPTVQDSSVLIVIAASSDSVTTQREYLP